MNNKIVKGFEGFVNNDKQGDKKYTRTYSPSGDLVEVSIKSGSDFMMPVAGIATPFKSEDGSEFPEILDYATQLRVEIVRPKEIISGLLHQGEVLMICGGMKTNKTWTMQELAISVTHGEEWLGMECEKGRVIYVDSEFGKYFFRDRIQKIEKVCGKIEPGMLGILQISGEGKTIDQLVDYLQARFSYGSAAMIVIDPIYTILGDREENKNDDIKDVGNLMKKLANATGASVVFAHHHTKGKRAGKRAIERASGGGAFGRFVDSSMDIESSGNGNFKFEFTSRNFPEKAPMIAMRVTPGPVWQVLDGVKPDDFKKPDQTTPAETAILGILNSQSLEVGAWRDECMKVLGVSDTAFKNRRGSASRKGYVKPVDGKWRLADGITKDEKTGNYALSPTGGLPNKSGYKLDRQLASKVNGNRPSRTEETLL